MTGKNLSLILPSASSMFADARTVGLLCHNVLRTVSNVHRMAIPIAF